MHFFRAVTIGVLGVALILGMRLSPPFAERYVLKSQPLSLESWQLQSPEDLRFGVLTLQRPNDAAPWQIHALQRLQSHPPRQIQQPPPQPSTQAPTGDSVLLAQLNHAGNNRLGGRQGAFQGPPSSARLSWEKAAGKQALHLHSDIQSEGYGGLWVLLVNPDELVFLDSRDYESLSFWVRGRGQYQIKVGDKYWFLKEDSLPVGPLDDYLSAGKLNGEWQQAVVPLSDLPPRLERKELASFVIQALGQGEQQLAVAELRLNRKDAKIPDFPSSPPPGQQAELATWVWHTQEWLDSPTLRARELAFLRAQRIRDLYLQLPSPARPLQYDTLLPGEIRFEVEPMQALIRELHAQGFRVHALDGDPQYALKAFHPGVLATVQHVINYNQSAPADARFDGLQYDIEPYLLPQYSQDSEAVHTQWGQLATQIYALTQNHQLHFGLAVPAWLDQPDEWTGRPRQVSLDGTKQALLDHLLAHSDYLAVMDYRTQLWNASGVLANMAQEWVRAEATGKKLVLALETMPLPDEKRYVLQGPPQQERPELDGPALQIFAEAQYKAAPQWKMRFLPAGTPPPEEREQQNYFWPLVHESLTPAQAISFASGSSEQLKRSVEALQNELSGLESFGGIALHHSKSLAELYLKKP